MTATEPPVEPLAADDDAIEPVEPPRMGVELVPIDSVEPHPDNPRLGDVGRIATLIATNGFYGSVIVQTSRRRIVVGHHRWRALHALQRDGWKQPGSKRVQSYAEIAQRVQLPPLGMVPVEWYDVDDTTAKRALLGDNRGSDAATWDDPKLSELLASMRAEDQLLGTGFSDRDAEDLLSKLRVPELDDLAARLGEPSVSDFWPVLRHKIHPETSKLWKEVVSRLAGPDAGDDDAVRAILRALTPSS